MSSVLRLYFCKNVNFVFSKKSLRRKDKRRLRQHKSLQNNISFKSSRALIKHLKLKNNISLSHKQNACAILKGRGRFGVDLEVLKDRDFIRLKGVCFNPDESRFADNLIRFYQIFTAKEALIKSKNLDFSHIGKIDVLGQNGYSIKSFIIDNEFMICVVFKGKKDIILKIL